jgi:primosomal protein N' (replication factor Y) (superfamily II helicase)
VLVDYKLQEDRVKFDINKSGTALELNEWQQQAFSEIQQHFMLKRRFAYCMESLLQGKQRYTLSLLKLLLPMVNRFYISCLKLLLLLSWFPGCRHFLGNRCWFIIASILLTNAWRSIITCLMGEKAKVILGARSSLFLPFKNLGLIVVDEEHETTFKQFDPAPRYNARDAAVVLANMHTGQFSFGECHPIPGVLL